MNKQLSVTVTPREEIARTRLMFGSSYFYDWDNQVFPNWYIRYGKPDYCMDFHFHDFFEFLIVKKGTLRLHTNSGVKMLCKGDIYIANPNEVHAGYIVNKEPLEYAFVHMNLKFLNNFGNSKIQKRIEEIKIGLLTARSYIPADNAANPELYSKLEHILKLLSGDQKESVAEFMRVAACFELLGTMTELDLFSRPKANNLRPKKDISAKVLSYIQAHYAEKITTKTVCEKFYYDEAQFCRMFRRNFGMSFLDFLNSYRIKTACHYNMSDKPTNMYEIARQVGFDNYSYFYRNFKKYTGKTPLEYFSQYEQE